MPFFKGKLELGTSIRGAWWDLYGNKKFIIESCELWIDDKQTLILEFNESEWKQFIAAMVNFASHEYKQIDKTQ